MFHSARPALLIAALAIGQTGVAAPPGASWYGRAGGPVGADRVTYIAETSGTLSFYRQLAFDLQPGRAGGAAPSVVRHEPVFAPVAVVQRYGRAGYPLIGMR